MAGCGAAQASVFCGRADVCPALSVTVIPGLPVSLQDRRRRLEWPESEKGFSRKDTMGPSKYSCIEHLTGTLPKKMQIQHDILVAPPARPEVAMF